MTSPLKPLPLSLILLGAILCLASDFPERPLPHQYIHNLSSELVISPEDEASLEEVYGRFSMETEVAFVGVIVDSLAGLEPRYYANELANRWKIGEEWEDRALLLLCALKDRKVFLATGKGVQNLITDDEASQLMVDYLVPRFRQGEYVEGLLDLASPIQAELGKPESSQSDLGLLIAIIIGLVFLLLQVLEHLNVLSIEKVDPRIEKAKNGSLGLIFVALALVLVYKTYFTLWPALISALLLALLANTWTLRGLMLIWDKVRPLARYTDEELDLKKAHAYLIFILFRSGKARKRGIAERVFFELLFDRALKVKFDEKKYSPVKGRKVGSDSYLVSKSDTYEESLEDVAFQSFYQTIFPSEISALLIFAITPAALFSIGERLVGSGIITFWSWKKGDWVLTEKGEKLRQDAMGIRADIDQLLENTELSPEELIEKLEDVRHILFALPAFVRRVMPSLLERTGSKASSEKKSVRPDHIDWEASWWYWTYMDYAQDAMALLCNLSDTLYPSSQSAYSGTRKNTSRSHSSYTDYHDSSSYSDGSFDGGGGGAEW